MKELPYFKFEPAEWLVGDISSLDYDAQGFFIQVCCFYWLKNCDVTLEMLNKRFEAKAKHLLSICLEAQIIKCENKIKITFLDEQFNKRVDISKKMKIAGSLGGQAKQSIKKTFVAKAKQKLSKSLANANIKEEILSPKGDNNITPYNGVILYKNLTEKEKIRGHGIMKSEFINFMKTVKGEYEDEKYKFQEYVFQQNNLASNYEEMFKWWRKNIFLKTKVNA
jgi:hypothetical protein